MYRKILVAYDGSPESRLALDECIRLAPGPATAIHLAGVVHDPSLYILAGEYVPEIALGDDEARVDADIKEAAAQLTAEGLAVTRHIVIGEPVTVIPSSGAGVPTFAAVTPRIGFAVMCPRRRPGLSPALSATARTVASLVTRFETRPRVVGELETGSAPPGANGWPR